MMHEEGFEREYFGSKQNYICLAIRYAWEKQFQLYVYSKFAKTKPGGLEKHNCLYRVGPRLKRMVKLDFEASPLLSDIRSIEF